MICNRLYCVSCRTMIEKDLHAITLWCAMLSLTKIIQSLIFAGNAKAQQEAHDVQDGKKEITSIRLRPHTRAYLQAQSEVLGVSVSQLINIIVDGVVSAETTPQKNTIDSIYERLMLLYENHNIPPIQMSQMLKKFGVTLSKLKSKDTMLDLITPEMLNEISSWFGVNRAWLSGESDVVYIKDCICWYKSEADMAEDIIERLICFRKVDVYVVNTSGIDLEVAETSNEIKNYMRMGFVIKFPQTISGISFDKYQVCEFQHWNYSGCRDQLKTLFRFFNKLESKHTGLTMTGISVDKDIISKLASGKVFPSEILNMTYRSELWSPEDYMKGYDENRVEGKLKRFIDAYYLPPTKRFYSEYDEIKGKRWRVEVYSDESFCDEYRHLGDALEGVYAKYHQRNN